MAASVELDPRAGMGRPHFLPPPTKPATYYKPSHTTGPHFRASPGVCFRVSQVFRHTSPPHLLNFSYLIYTAPWYIARPSKFASTTHHPSSRVPRPPGLCFGALPGARLGSAGHHRAVLGDHRPPERADWGSASSGVERTARILLCARAGRSIPRPGEAPTGRGRQATRVRPRWVTPAPLQLRPNAHNNPRACFRGCNFDAARPRVSCASRLERGGYL